MDSAIPTFRRYLLCLYKRGLWSSLLYKATKIMALAMRVTVGLCSNYGALFESRDCPCFRDHEQNNVLSYENGGVIAVLVRGNAWFGKYVQL